MGTVRVCLHDYEAFFTVYRPRQRRTTNKNNEVTNFILCISMANDKKKAFQEKCIFSMIQQRHLSAARIDINLVHLHRGPLVRSVTDALVYRVFGHAVVKHYVGCTLNQCHYIELTVKSIRDNKVALQRDRDTNRRCL